jgi:hypothetical protein
LTVSQKSNATPFGTTAIVFPAAPGEAPTGGVAGVLLAPSSLPRWHPPNDTAINNAIHTGPVLDTISPSRV